MASITRSRGTAARRRRADAIERVLKAVEDLLESGELFTELPVGRIAEESRIPRSTFYQYFPNKSQVLIEVAGLASEALFAAPARWYRSAPTGADGVGQIELAVGTMMSEYRRHRSVMRALNEVSTYDPDVAEFWIGLINGHIQSMAVAVRAWQSAGAVPQAVDPEGTTTAIVWMVERSISQHVLDPERSVRITDETLVRSLARSIWLSYFSEA